MGTDRTRKFASKDHAASLTKLLIRPLLLTQLIRSKSTDSRRSNHHQNRHIVSSTLFSHTSMVRNVACNVTAHQREHRHRPNIAVTKLTLQQMFACTGPRVTHTLESSRQFSPWNQGELKARLKEKNSWCFIHISVL